MFELAYVILPFGDADPGEAIRASLARYQRGGIGQLPPDWLEFDDETALVQAAHEASLTFTRPATGGLSVRGSPESVYLIDSGKVLAEMERRGLPIWSIRFADEMSLDAFARGFGQPSERDPETGRFGRWLNGLGRWDWWDLGGRFDGWLTGDPRAGGGRSVSPISSGPSPGRQLLANVEDTIGKAVGQEIRTTTDVRTDCNIEIASTVLESLRLDRTRPNAGALVLPPGVVEDRLRWLRAWPVCGPAEAFTYLGVAPDAPWPDVVEASLERFSDHWVAGVAYHL